MLPQGAGGRQVVTVSFIYVSLAIDCLDSTHNHSYNLAIPYRCSIHLIPISASFL